MKKEKNLQKWKIYGLTFITYASIHAIRTSWSSLKTVLIQQPYYFTNQFEGLTDMIALFALAISLNLFGWLASKWNVRYFLFIGMGSLIVTQILLALILKFSVKSQPAYLILFAAIGAISCTGWPSVFFIISKYFSKKDGIVLSIWNASSQFGDFFSFFISFLIVDNSPLPNPDITSSVIFTTAGLVGIILILNYFFLHPKDQQVKKNSQEKQERCEQQFIEQSPPEGMEKNEEIIKQTKQNCQQNVKTNGEQNILPQNVGLETQNQSQSKDSQKNIELQQKIPAQNNKGKRVTFLTVWLLPSVPSYILVFSMTKSINTIMVNWLVVYLTLIGLTREARVLSIAWALSIFVGGLLFAYFNPKLSKKVFIGCLLLSSICFTILDQLHNSLLEVGVVFSICICGLLFGGPYNLMCTAVPLMLADRQQIKSKEGAFAAIISAMEGCGQFLGALFMIIIPIVGIDYLNDIPAILCFLSGIILVYEQVIDWKKRQVKKIETVEVIKSGSTV